MKITKSEFLGSAVSEKQYPDQSLPEIAFAGRSNVGKSSLLNLITSRKKLAKVSQNPGKTRQINFFLINDSFRIVDLPGYGYAKVSKSESEKWGKMMEHYLENRPNLVKVIQLVDSRHEPSAQDRQMYDYLRYYGLSGVVVATKSDKLSKNELIRNLSLIRKSLSLEKDDILIAVSALSKSGTEEMLDIIEKLVSVDAADL